MAQRRRGGGSTVDGGLCDLGGDEDDATSFLLFLHAREYYACRVNRPKYICAKLALEV